MTILPHAVVNGVLQWIDYIYTIISFHLLFLLIHVRSFVGWLSNVGYVVSGSPVLSGEYLLRWIRFVSVRYSYRSRLISFTTNRGIFFMQNFFNWLISKERSGAQQDALAHRLVDIFIRQICLKENQFWYRRYIVAVVSQWRNIFFIYPIVRGTP